MTQGKMLHQQQYNILKTWGALDTVYGIPIRSTQLTYGRFG